MALRSPVSRTAEWDARIEPDGSVWLCIPGEPVSLNQLNTTTGLRILKMTYKLPCFDCAEVQVVYYFRTNRRRDQDNFTPKLLIDAMREAGILADDNAEALRLLPVEFRADKQRPRTEVFVREWREVSP